MSTTPRSKTPGGGNSLQESAKRASTSPGSRSPKRRKSVAPDTVDLLKYKSPFEGYLQANIDPALSTLLKDFLRDLDSMMKGTDEPEPERPSTLESKATRLARTLLMGKKHLKTAAPIDGGFKPDISDMVAEKRQKKLNISQCIQIENTGLKAIEAHQLSGLDVKRYLLHTWYYTAVDLPRKKDGSPRINRQKVVDENRLYDKKQADHLLSKLKNLKHLVDGIGKDGKNILYLTDLAGDGGGSFLRNLTSPQIELGLQLLQQYETEGIPSKDDPSKYIWLPQKKALFRNMYVDDYASDDDDYCDDEDNEDAENNRLDDVEIDKRFHAAEVEVNREGNHEQNAEDEVNREGNHEKNAEDEVNREGNHEKNAEDEAEDEEEVFSDIDG
ncbi:hypothetical protein BC832DRAFT_622920 [Gaertneriomyces semiglobifer]|nr:hypothetical protein BC832DRAFT_622920 [Gaertneriomyces semiglobifer]